MSLPKRARSDSQAGSSMWSLAIISMVQPDRGLVIHTSWSGLARIAIDSAMKCTALSTKIRVCGRFWVCSASA